MWTSIAQSLSSLRSENHFGEGSSWTDQHSRVNWMIARSCSCRLGDLIPVQILEHHHRCSAFLQSAIPPSFSFSFFTSLGLLAAAGQMRPGRDNRHQLDSKRYSPDPSSCSTSASKSVPTVHLHDWWLGKCRYLNYSLVDCHRQNEVEDWSMSMGDVILYWYRFWIKLFKCNWKKHEM